MFYFDHYSIRRLKNSQMKLFESKTALERTQKKVQSNIDGVMLESHLNVSSPFSPISLRLYVPYMYVHFIFYHFIHSHVFLCLPMLCGYPVYFCFICRFYVY